MTVHHFPRIDDALVRRVDALLRSFVAEHRHRFLEGVRLVEDGDAIRLEFVWSASEQGSTMMHAGRFCPFFVA